MWLTKQRIASFPREERKSYQRKFRSFIKFSLDEQREEKQRREEGKENFSSR